MTAKIRPLIIIGAVVLSLCLASASTSQAQQSAVAQQLHASGQNAKQAATAASQSVKHAYEATADEVSDATLTSKVKLALWNDSQTKHYTIHVASDQGLVTLTGQVDTPSTASFAGRVAAQVSGVRSVRNQLTWPAAVKQPIAGASQ